MSNSPDRILARVVLTSLALAGFLILVALELLILIAGSAVPATAALRCLITPASSVDTAVHASAVAIGVLAAIPILTGVWAASRTRAAVIELQNAAKIARVAMPPRVAAAATMAQVYDRIDVVVAPRLFAFAYGWIRPRVCLSNALIDALDDHELEAVLLHEGWHVFRRDPFRLWLAEMMGVAFTAVPEVRRLVRLYELAIEVAADRHVVAVMGHSRWLASALVKTLAPPVATPSFEGRGEARISALAGKLPAAPRGRGRIAVAALILEFLAFVPLLTSGSIVSLTGFWIHPAC